MYRIASVLIILSILMIGCTSDEEAGTVKGVQTSRPESTETSPPEPDTAEDGNSAVSSVINASNVDQLVEIASFGRGTLFGYSWLPDGHTLAVTTSTDVRLYDVQSPDKPQQIFNQFANLLDVDQAVTRGLSRSNENKWILWSLDTGEQIVTLETGDSQVQRAEFSPDGAIINVIAGSAIQQFDGETGDPLEVLTLPVDAIYRVAYLNAQLLIAVAYADSMLAVWDVMAGEILFEIGEYETSPLVEMEFKADGRILVVPNAEVTVMSQGMSYRPIDIDIWDTLNGEIIQTLPYGLSQVSISEDGTSYVVTEYSQRIELHDLITKEELLVVGGDEGGDFTVGVSSLQLSPDNQWIAARLTEGRIALYSVEDPEFSAEITDFDTWITGVGLSPDSAILAIGYRQSGLKTWDIASHEMIDSMTPERSGIMALASHPLENSVYVGTTSISRHQMTALQDSAESLMAIQANHLAVSPDGKYLVLDYTDLNTPSPSGQRDSYLRIWDLEENDLHLPDITLPGGARILQMIFSPDGTQVALSAEDNTVSIVDVATGTLQHTLTSDKEITGIAFHPVDQRLAVVTSELTMIDETTPAYEADVRVWDTTSGELLETLVTHDHWLHSAAYSPDGSLLAVGAEDGMGGFLLVEANSGELLRDRHEDSIAARELMFSDDGGLLVAVGTDNIVRLWTLEPSAE